MNKLLFKLTTAVSTAALLTGSVASVAFGTTTVTVSGNGADSNNTANVSLTNSNQISQTNDANIQNNVTVNANSGNNTAEKNTGGDTSVSTGDANVSSSVSNSANSNVASVGCNSCAGSTEVKIAGNGAGSENTVNLGVSNKTMLSQNNEANVTNKVKIDVNTGDNKANKNTGGDTSISTGDINVTGGVTNDVNQNVARIGGGNGGSLSAEIIGNGADSENKLNLNVGTDVEVAQVNNANIKNSVTVDANSGDNRANENTGGNTSIKTGDADVTVAVNNRANSNALDLSSCDCAINGSVKIAGNGADSDNTAKVTLGSLLAASQVNDFSCGGGERWWGWFGGRDCAGVHVNSNTGDNKANENTIHGSDPMVSTGDAGGNVTVHTQANSNVLGNSGINLPSLPNMNDLNGLLILLMGMFHSG